MYAQLPGGRQDGRVDQNVFLEKSRIVGGVGLDAPDHTGQMQDSTGPDGSQQLFGDASIAEIPVPAGQVDAIGSQSAHGPAQQS
ncbi:MAG: hypothetical protein HP495_03735 [Nitrospira sp.]|nr:hypothetical protein [Nitrospira sp.]